MWNFLLLLLFRKASSIHLQSTKRHVSFVVDSLFEFYMHGYNIFRLMKMGHEVSVVDNFFTGRKRNIEHWIGHENFELLHHDVVAPLFIEVIYDSYF